MEINDLDQLLSQLVSDGTPAALAMAWIIQRLQDNREELEEIRYQLNSIEAKVNILHEAKFGA